MTFFVTVERLNGMKKKFILQRKSTTKICYQRKSFFFAIFILLWYRLLEFWRILKLSHSYKSNQECLATHFEYFLFYPLYIQHKNNLQYIKKCLCFSYTFEQKPSKINLWPNLLRYRWLNIISFYKQTNTHLSISNKILVIHT